jgi:hypothetical protein
MLSYKVNLKIEVMNFLINWMLNYVQWFEYIRMYSTFWLVFINQIIKTWKNTVNGFDMVNLKELLGTLRNSKQETCRIEHRDIK